MRSKRRAFTLVELLIVIGIISLLIGILVPALNQAKKSSENVKCLSNLRQLGSAAQLHSNEFNSRIPPAGVVIPASDEGKYPFGGYKNPFRAVQNYDNGGVPHPVPWIAALAKYLAIPMRTDTVDHIAVVPRADKTAVAVILTCAAADYDAAKKSLGLAPGILELSGSQTDRQAAPE